MNKLTHFDIGKNSSVVALKLWNNRLTSFDMGTNNTMD